MGIQIRKALASDLDAVAVITARRQAPPF